MATAYLYSFNKRRNSTALPTLSSGRAVTLVLKDGTSLTDPTFILSSATRPTENYIQFEGRFYHVLEVTSIRQGIWGFNCHVDVLATYKANIQASTAFVAYDTTANTEISDGRLSLKTTSTYNQNTGSGWTYLGGGSCVILNVIGAEGVDGDQNGVASYAVTIDTARTLMARIKDFSENLYPEPLEPAEDFLESFNQFLTVTRDTSRQAVKYKDATACIKSAIIFPSSYDRVYGWGDTELWLGEYRVNVPCRRAQFGAYDRQTVTIPWQTNDWRRNAPYTEILLYLPYVGVVNIPVSAVMGCTSLTVEYDFTYADGGCTVKVCRDSYEPLTPTSGVIYKASTNLGGGYAIGESVTSGFNTWVTSMAGAVATIGAAVISGGTAAVAAAGSAAILGVGNSLTQSPTSIGSSSGGLLESTPNVICAVNFHDTVVAPDSVSAFMGTPAMAVKSLSGLSGYVETRLFSVSGTMLENERIEINRFMDGGVYIE